MSKRVSSKTISAIKKLRAKGWSLPELKRKFSNVGYGTIYRHVKDVGILPEFEKIWAEKRKSSVSRMKRAEIEAHKNAKKIVKSLSFKERLLFLSALYWGEGTKKDLSLTNSDPEMIKLFVKGVTELLNVNNERIKINIRIFEDMNQEKCINHWLKVTGLTTNHITAINVLKGKKLGKLEFGICRVRVLKGSNVLKYLKAVKEITKNLFSPS